MKGWSALLSVATVLACSSRAILVAPASTNAAGAQGLAGAGGSAGTGGSAGSAGAAGAAMPLGICPSRTGRRPGQLALRGADGSDIILVHDDGATQRVSAPDARSATAQRNGWIAAYNYGGTATWKAMLIDSSGHVRADSSGQAPPGPAGTWAISQANVLPDGTATFDLGNTEDDLVLTPDGRVRRRPYFSTEPDAAGWVATNLSDPKLIVGIPVMLNVETGE